MNNKKWIIIGVSLLVLFNVAALDSIEKPGKVNITVIQPQAETVLEVEPKIELEIEQVSKPVIKPEIESEVELEITREMIIAAFSGEETPNFASNTNLLTDEELDLVMLGFESHYLELKSVLYLCNQISSKADLQLFIELTRDSQELLLNNITASKELQDNLTTLGYDKHIKVIPVLYKVNSAVDNLSLCMDRVIENYVE